MLGKIENFFFNKFAGKLIARAAVSLSGLAAGKAAALGINLDPVEVASALTIGAHWLYETIKKWRNKTPQENPATGAPDPKA